MCRLIWDVGWHHASWLSGGLMAFHGQVISHHFSHESCMLISARIDIGHTSCFHLGMPDWPSKA